MTPDLSKLPEDVRPFGERLISDYGALDQPFESQVAFECMAWGRWAGEKSNEDLAGVILWVRKTMCGSDQNILSEQLAEAAARLLAPRKFRQRFR